VEWILLSLVILAAAFGATGGVVYYYHRIYDRHLQQRLLREKQLAIYEEITCLVSEVKAAIAYSSGDETLRQWRQAMMDPLKEMLGKSYRWSIFLPDSIGELPAEYASKVAHGLSRLDQPGPGDLAAVAEIIADIKKLENEAARQLEARIRQAMGID
jgi:hypothetical protein